MPLDPSYPPARIAAILEDSQAGLIMTNNQCFSLADELCHSTLQLVNTEEIDASLSAENLGLSISPDTHSWILYTSGSTGKPKGVVQNHRNVLHFIMNFTNGFHLCADDRLTLLFSCCVNGGAHEIFSALLNGASLHLLDIKAEGLTQMANWLIEHEITIYCSVPTLFQHFIDTLTGKERFHNLRLIKLIGEPVYKKHVELYKQHFPERCIFVNRLGSTETGSIRWNFIDKKTQINGIRVPVGYPVEDNEILLLDEAGKEVGTNNIGEIAVKSRYLSPGYWKRPDLTRAVFLHDPKGGDKRIYRTGDLGRILTDGCLQHLGRKDFQVKIRGHRIEVSEIEMALLDLPVIKEAVVMARENQSGDPSAPLRTGKRLVAYLVPASQPVPKVSQLRSFLKNKLPDYMIPSIFMFVEAFPLAPNGKVHRQALPAPTSTRPELDTPFSAPRTPLEKILGGIWAEVLSLDRVGIHDNFFDFGGHSLLATQIISRVLNTLHVEVPMRSMFESPTVAEMAVVIVQNQAKKAGPKDLARMLTELESLSVEEAQRLLAEERGKDDIL